MNSGVSFAGIHKKGQLPRRLAARGGSTMSSGSDEGSQDRRRASGSGSGLGQQNRVARRSAAPRQLITFVDSQDPNSRSTIQRHTAHHSNAQRRDARLQSLRSTNRPRILRWSRRQSAEVLPVTSPASSRSSSSISPLPPTQQLQPSREQAASDPLSVAVEAPSVEPPPPPHPPPPPPPQPQPPSQPAQTAPSADRFSPQRESAIQYLIEHLCGHSPHRTVCEDIIAFARTDEACANLLLAYSVSLRRHNGESMSVDSDINAARNYMNRGTSLLRARLSDSLTATADANIQAVLLLIAYTADYGSFEQVRIHTNALQTMIDQRGGTGEENYPPILALQLRTVGRSRFLHLTLDCGETCEALPRFPHGLYGV